MIWLNGTLATASFEFRRSLTWQRIAVAMLLALFPPLMVTVSLIIARGTGVAAFVEFQIILLTALVTTLSLLLWATPIVYNEIESRGWVFLASRPFGRVSVYLGKYLAAVLFTVIVAVTSISVCIAIATILGVMDQPYSSWMALTAIFVLASFAYGAIFAMVGTVLFKRAMAAAAGFMLFWEGIVASLPAIINRFTMRYHLQSLAIEWLGYYLPPRMLPRDEYAMVYGEPLAWFHVTFLVAATAVFLAAGLHIIVNRQYATADDAN